MSKVFVGGLSWGINSDGLRQRFEEFGTVEDAIVLLDRETGRSRGFGFVTFTNPEDAQRAIDGTNETEFDGRTIRVNFANERDSSSGPRPGRRPFNNRSGYNGGGYQQRSNYGYGQQQQRDYSGNNEY
ncbi:hypothetical protein GGI12_001949 [Dipsacomyces acuminosporus]|nr:hypothetical protein GGI12_001949 [Dipsacomyces acuminosporus]